MKWWIAPAIIFSWLAVLAVAQSPWLSWEEPTVVVDWPAESAIARGEASRTVLMFVHPDCECTQTSLKILEQVAANLPESASWLVVAWRPPGSDWKPETSLPVYFDEGGVETKRFGVTTSGHLVLFDGDGLVLYSGSVNDFRGSNEESDGVQLREASLHYQSRVRLWMSSILESRKWWPEKSGIADKRRPFSTYSLTRAARIR